MERFVFGTEQELTEENLYEWIADDEICVVDQNTGTVYTSIAYPGNMRKDVESSI